MRTLVAYVLLSTPIVSEIHGQTSSTAAPQEAQRSVPLH
jgi:hypothetical protein